MTQIDRTGYQYSGNLLDWFLSFNDSADWVVSSGTGFADHSDNWAFDGDKCLRLQNTAPTTDLIATSSVQNTEILIKNADAELMFYLRKDSPLDEFSGSIELFKNSVSIGVETFVLEAEMEDQWYKFISENTYAVARGDIITFKWTFNGDAGFTGAKTLYIDGMMLYNKERGDFAPALYNVPTLNAPVIPTSDVNLYTGWGSYGDTTYTEGSPLTIIDGATAVDLPNDKGTAIESQKPSDITTFYDGTIITGREGDGINLTIDFKCKPTTGAANPRLTVAIDIGGGIPELYTRDFVLAKGSGVEHNYLSSFNAYTLDTWEANGGTLKISANNDNIEVYDIRYVITRTHKAV